MSRHIAIQLSLAPSAEQLQALARHAGCRRFAYNLCVAELKRCLDARRENPDAVVPRSKFDFINLVNRWRKAQLAEHRAAGRPGKPWCYEVSAQVWEEAAVDAARAYRRFLDGRKPGATRRSGFPRFCRKNADVPRLRIRAHGDGIRLGEDALHLPRLGEVAVKESTRRVRRMLAPGRPERAKLLFATLKQVAGRWHAWLNLEAPDVHPALRRQPSAAPPDWVGIDVGLNTFAVAADTEGTQCWAAQGPKALAGELRRLRRACRVLHRRKPQSHRRAHARARLAALHARVARIRHDFLHRLSRHVVNSHAHVALEDLHIAGMLQNRRLARHIADASWGRFAHYVTYKGAWYGTEVRRVARFAPTTKRCSRCDAVVPPLPLSQRVFTCPHCALVIDRDVNAAANCARWAQAHPEAVADKQSET